MITSMEDLKAYADGHGMAHALAAVRQGADDGNTFCQVFMSNALMRAPENTRRPDHQEQVEHYTRLAAEGGDPGSQFNLAKIHLSRVDASKGQLSPADIENVRLCKRWNREAAEQGFAPSIAMLRDLAAFDFD